MATVIKRVDVEVTYPDGRVLTGFSWCMPEHNKQVFYQIWLKEGQVDTMLINMQMAESIKLTPIFEK
jgi:hypothetical protein